MTEPGSTVPAAPTAWQWAKVVAIREETPRAKTFRLGLDKPSVHLAGQHFVVRLTAPDGYRASRSYSLASPPDGTNEVEITVERLEDGEVSAFLHDDVVVGDELEVRGPIGGFVWTGEEPAVLIGGGSGVVPLMAMLRLSRSLVEAPPVRLLVSVRSPEDLYYASELAGDEVSIIYTRSSPEGSTRAAGRLAARDVRGVLLQGGVGYVCGPAGFVDHATSLLVAEGMPSSAIRTERFGPTG